MSALVPEVDVGRLKWCYEMMVRIRVFEEAVADLVEAGQIITPCHFCIGQEAIATGVAAALNQTDYVWGGHRSHGHYLAKGGNIDLLMAEIMCRATGCSGGRGGSMHVCAPEVGVVGTVPIVAATVPLAVGAGLAETLRNRNGVSVAFFGDGAIEEGHIHESLNLAALMKLPVLFVCENNLYSSHMGLLQRRAKDNIVETGNAHGIAAERVDGNDIREVIHAAERAVGRARRGEGPTLLECRTFRWRGHVGPAWDMDVGVRRNDEIKEWLKRDPIAHCRGLLVAQGVSADEIEQMQQLVQQEVANAVRFATDSPHPSADDFAKFVYSAA